jgi:hypothetical protein
MRYMSSQLPQPVRLVGLSHSLANARDVGEWLGAAGTSTFNFPPGVRPVPLEIHMHGLDIHNFEARMQVGVNFLRYTSCSRSNYSSSSSSICLVRISDPFCLWRRPKVYYSKASGIRYQGLMAWPFCLTGMSCVPLEITCTA